MTVMDRFDVSYPQVVLMGLLIVTVIGLVFAASTSSAAFGSYNAAWDGASELRDEAMFVDTESELIRNTSRYASVPPNGTIAIILSPQSGYGPAETDRIRTFVRNGGTLLVAEDFGQHSNELLARIGAQARVSGQLIRDERYNYHSPALPVARNVSNHTLVQGVDALTLNHGTPVRPNGATVLVSTSAYAYVDANGNGDLDTSENVGTYPVATVESVGDGRVIVVGDPSAFINAMLDRPGNRAFVRSVFSAHERVLLDYSHAGRLPPLSVALLVVRDAPLLQFLLSMAGIVAIGLWTRNPGVPQRFREVFGTDERFRPDAGTDELASFVRRQHPEWDDERVERVIGGIMTRRQESSNDD
ncbi:MAG TPA: DUF4350 domain-containing protein [Halococcus sp.]|nr:DUF4350 domain-containing protein [Halococcus sp.]